MFKTAERTIEKFDLIKENDRIVVSLSGGPDSTALLFFLMEIRERYGLELFGVHVNHMIRGAEAQRDADFVKGLCGKNRIELLTVKKNVPEMSLYDKISIEEAGRAARLEACREAVSYFWCHKAATGHNKNDNAETFLMRLSRGSGSKGLSGISPQSDINGVKIIRPLIECQRSEIEKYCVDNNILALTDSTNNEAVYTRNKVRLTLIPWLEENINKDIINTLVTTAEILREQNEFMEHAARSAFAECLISEAEGVVKLDIEVLNENNPAIRKLVVREALGRLPSGLKNMTKSHIDCILALSGAGTGKRISLPGKAVCKTEYGRLVFSTETENPGFNYELMPGQPVYINEKNIYVTFSDELLNLKFKNLYTKMFKCDKILFKLSYRTRCPGDRIKLPGGTKKLSDYFIDKKTPVNQRAGTALIAEGSHVLSIPGECDSEYVKNGKNRFFIQFWEDTNGKG